MGQKNKKQDSGVYIMGIELAEYESEPVWVAMEDVHEARKQNVFFIPKTFNEVEEYIAKYYPVTDDTPDPNESLKRAILNSLKE